MKQEYVVKIPMYGGPERLCCILYSTSIKNAIRQLKRKPPLSMKTTYYIFESGHYEHGVQVTL